MASPLPPDPYKALGVTKLSDAVEIKTAYRKLVLKCHPDKVRDDALKATMQEEFTKVQQAWEILGDADKRRHYDTQVEVMDLRKEMGRTTSSPRTNKFEFDIRTEPKRTYSRSRPSRDSPKVYAHRPAKSHEDMAYELHTASASRRTSYDTKRDKPTVKDPEKERERERRRAAVSAAAAEEEAKIRAKLAKEARKIDAKYEAADKKKTRDRERKDKMHARSAYVEESTDEDLRAQARAAEKKARRSESVKVESAATTIRKGSMTTKHSDMFSSAADYMQKANRRTAKVGSDFRPSIVKRAETFAAAPSAQFDARYPLKSSDDESPRRAAARLSRRATEGPPKSKDSPKVASKEKRSRAAPFIVEEPSKPPTLQPQTSAPPFVSLKQNRSKTSEYPRPDGPPSMPRAATYTASQSRRTKLTPEYADSTSSESESEEEAYQSRRPRSPPRRTSYVVENGRSIPINKARVDAFDEAVHEPQAYVPDSPPRVRHSSQRPSISQRASSTTRAPNSSYYPPNVVLDPMIINASRPKMPGRSSSRSIPQRVPLQFADVKYGPKISQADVLYSTPTEFRKEPTHYVYTTRGPRNEVYA